MKKTIYCPDIVCESCVKVLKKTFDKMKGINTYEIKEDAIDIEYNPEEIKEDELLKYIHAKGYRASFSVFGKKNFKERAKEFFTDKEKYKVEYTMLRYTIFTFLLLIALEIFVYYSFFQESVGFLQTYGWWFLYSTIAIVTLGAALFHFHAYRAQVTMMVGMMIGMTIGMLSSIMFGAIIGATNGLFMGSVIGVVLGVTLGIFNGKCCGIMGILEGMMAGLMGGTMGPMIAAMLRFDHLLLFMPLFTVVYLMILWGFSYMLYEEVVEERPNIETKLLDFWTFFAGCFIALIVVGIIMIYGYSSAPTVYFS